MISLQIEQYITEIVQEIDHLPVDQKIEAINTLKLALHDISPFFREPVDCVIWVKGDRVIANEYNPNVVAPVEFALLEHSISEDGYTQPIVTWQREDDQSTGDEIYEVVDGFHRNKVGKQSKEISKRIRGYLPVTVINSDRTHKADRIAATIRHNRARGKHQVAAMSDIVVELKHRNWSDERIGRELGMDQDEVLRLCQITGLAELFSDQDFSRAWDAEGEVTESDFLELSDDVATFGEESNKFRTVNTSDESRIFHTHDKWECFKAGLYADTKPGMTKQECEEAYRDFLSDSFLFSDALHHVITEWKHSCEHYLTNIAMNRIAWLGQAAACYATGVPAAFRSGFYLLTDEQQKEANEVALEYLNKWLEANNRPTVSMEEAYSYDRQSDIY